MSVSTHRCWEDDGLSALSQLVDGTKKQQHGKDRRRKMLRFRVWTGRFWANVPVDADPKCTSEIKKLSTWADSA
ncbi:G-Protein Coupled Receptor 52 [Manis pentadactyla]|nr:G-Protein Coupled Receptor 52 [Manis pentadactyla]